MSYRGVFKGCAKEPPRRATKKSLEWRSPTSAALPAAANGVRDVARLADCQLLRQADMTLGIPCGSSIGADLENTFYVFPPSAHTHANTHHQTLCSPKEPWSMKGPRTPPRNGAMLTKDTHTIPLTLVCHFWVGNLFHANS